MAKKKAQKGNGHAGKLHIAFILDKSGSMQIVQNATISGFNEFLADQKKAKTRGRFTLTMFDTEVVERFKGIAIQDVAPLTKETYIPDGMTALHDAVAKTIRGFTVPDGERVLCAILTDGEENSSREHSLTEIKALIDEKQNTGLWTFAYLGANQDAWAVGSKMGIPTGNIANYASTSSGTMAAMANMSVNTRSFASSGRGSTSSYFNGQSAVPDPGDAYPAPPANLVVPPMTARIVGEPKDQPTWRKRR